MSMITPHGGGTLVDLCCAPEARGALAAKIAALPAVRLSFWEETDLESLAVGTFSPLRGFMTEAETKSVTDEMHLPDGTPWTIPVTLSTSRVRADEIDVGDEVALETAEGRRIAMLRVEDKFESDLGDEARKVFLTDEDRHPGVAALYRQAEVRLGGPVTALELPRGEFPEYRLSPAQSRSTFEARGWRTITGFQTRNPIHRAHEYLTKCALEMTDGLFLHPLVGETKGDDIPAEIRVRCYEVLIEHYYNAERVVLGVLPASMRYAGPREAILHAIVRRNYGCTHFIVGRDHAGVGDYYGTYAAHEIFDRFEPAALGIVPLRFEHSFYCTKVGGMASEKTTNSDPAERILLSGTRVREMLRAGERPPPELTRPEVAEILVASLRDR